MKTNFRDIMKGVMPLKDTNGDVVYQSIANMTLVFLTLEHDRHSCNDFANPLGEIDKLKTSSSDYGQLTLENNTSKDFLIPPQLAVLSKEKAQNHAMVKGAILRKGMSQTYHDAGCVEGSEGGHISRSAQ